MRDGDGARRYDPDEVRFVLLEPRSGGNVGAAARALKNLGFTRLAFVRPDCEPLGDEARRMAVDAVDLLQRADLHRTLDAALDGAQTVVGSSARTGKHRRPHWRLDRLPQELAGHDARGELAVLFGREDRGLTDGELDRCTHLVRLPAADSYPSFNLAQAVLLVAYELRLAQLGPDEALDPPATHEVREAFYAHFERAMLAIGFIRPETSAVIMRRLRRALGRALLSEDEIALLRGVARQTLWAAERAGLPPPPEGSEEPD
jgi:TrmH family RNA methyltransferase